MRMDPCPAALSAASVFYALARLKPGVTLGPGLAPTFSAWCPFGSTPWPMVPGYSVTSRSDAELADHAGRGGRSRTTWSAVSPARSGCSWARSARCCWSRAPTSRTSCSCAPMRGDLEFAVRAALGATPCTDRPRAARREPSSSARSAASLGLALAYGGLELLVAIGPGQSAAARRDRLSTCPSSRSQSRFRSRRRSRSARSRRWSTRGT